MTHEIVMGGTPYTFKFGLGFLKEMNSRVQIPINGAPGYKVPSGLAYKIGQIIDGSVEDLIDVLLVANKTENPRITVAVLEKYIEEEVTDMDAFFEEVLDFLRTSNFTQKTMKMVESKAEEVMAEQKPEN